MTEKHPVAPASGVRIKGKTYLPGQRLPKQYGRISENGQLSLDPARGVGDAPPNFGRDVLPSILSFSGRSSVVSHVYKNPDVAYTEGGVASIRAMRNDCSIMECLEARQRGTALLNWHLEPEDKKDPKQKQLADDLTDILQATPDFTEYRRCLLEAIWYGRYAVQHAYGWQVIKGNRRCVVTRWSPINGDKLVFRYDDGTGKYSGDEIGIKVGLAYGRADKIAGDRKIEMTDQGPCYFLEPWERSRLAIHKHIIEDGVYEDATSAGRIHGVGVRDRIYWTWFQQQNTMGQLMELIERTGNGITLYRYPDGNPKAQAEIEEIAKRNTNSNIIIMPSMPDFPDAYAIDRVEPSTAGITALKDILHEFFGWRIKRYIIGQIRSSEPVAGGLGTSDGDVQKDTLNQIVAYDAVKLEETLTREFVNTLKMFNFAWARDIAVKFVIDTESADAQRKLTAFKAAWDMGLKIKDSDVYDSIGASMPGADEPFLQNPQLAQQQPGAMPGGEGIQASDAFGPAMGDEGQDEGGGQPPPDDQPDQPKGPVQYAAGLGADPRWKTKHTPGETKSIQGHTYVLNEHHRWELQNRDEVEAAQADTIDANSTPKDDDHGDDEGGFLKLPDHPPEDAEDHEQRHAHVAKALGSVDPQASGLIRAFHEHPDYKSGGEVASQKLDPNHAQQLHSWLSQSAAKGDGPPIIMADGSQVKSSRVGGGIAVDFGDGRTGFASEAGSFVVGQDGKANYTSKTGIVKSAMGGKPMLNPQGAQPNAQTPPQTNAAPQAGPAGPAPSPAPQAVAGPAWSPEQAAPADPIKKSGQAPTPAPSPNPHRDNADKAHAEWQEAVKGMADAGNNGADAKDLAAWSRYVTHKRKVFREYDLAAKHHDKANKPGNGPPAGPVAATAPGGLSDSDKATLRGMGIDPDKMGDRLQEHKSAATVDPKLPKFGSPEAIAMARRGIDPTKSFTTGEQDRKAFADKIAARTATPLLPNEGEHAHHKALHETLSEAAANEPDDAKAASLAAQAVHHEALADHHKSAVHSPAVHAAIQAAHEALHKSGLAEAPAGQGGYVPPSDEALAKLKGLGQKGEKKADPDAWKNSVKRRLVDADLHTHPRNVNAINEAIERGQIKSPEDLKSVLGTARDLAHGKNAIPDMEKDTHEAVRQALGRKARRKERAPTVKPEAMLAEGAKKHGIEPEEYADLADHVWQTEAMNSPNRKPEGYAGAVAALRKHTGFKSASAAQNDDEKELPDDLDMIFREHPELGVSPDASTQEQEDAAWDILKSDDDGGSGIPSKNSPEYWAFADDAIRQMKEHEAANPPSREDESVPFAARWRDGYTARQYAKIRESVERAVAETAVEPSEAQKEAGNYAKGRVTLHGLPIAIENPKGSSRRPEWKPLAHHYGYISRTEGKDGDAVDCFIGPCPESEVAFVVDQLNAAGKFDEHKVMLGFTNEAEAKQGYLDNYPAGWKCGEITPMTTEQFGRWLDSGDTTKPVCDQVSHYARKPLKSTKGQTTMFGTTHGIEGAGPATPYDEKKHSRGTAGAFREIGPKDGKGQKKIGFDESKHPRGMPENKGEFAPKGTVHDVEKPAEPVNDEPPKQASPKLSLDAKLLAGKGNPAGWPENPTLGEVNELAKKQFPKSLKGVFISSTGSPDDKRYFVAVKTRVAGYGGMKDKLIATYGIVGMKDAGGEIVGGADAEAPKLRDEKPADSFSLARPGEYQPPKGPPEEKPKPAKQDKMFHGMDALPGQQDLFEGLDKGGGDGSPKSVSVTSESHDKAEHVTDHAVYGMDDLPGQTKMFGGMDLGGREPLENEAKSGENDGMNESEVIAGYAAKVASGQMQHSSAKDKLKKKGIAEPGKKLAAAVEKLREGGNAKAKLDAMSKAKELAESGDVHRALIALNPKISKEVLEQSPGFYDDIEQFDGDTIEEKLNDAAHRGYHDTLDHEREQEAEAEEQRKIDDEREAAEKDEAERRSEPHVVANLKQRAEIAKHEIDRTNDRKEKRLYRADIQMPDAHAAMLKAGWKFEYQSKSGSMYYRKGDSQARLADHEVPATSEREHNKQHGGFSWSDADNQVILPVDDIGEAVRGLDDDPPAPSPAVPKGPEPKGDGGGAKPIDYNPGDKVTIPASHTAGEFPAELDDAGDGMLGIRQAGKNHGALGAITKISKRQFPQFMNDLHGKVEGAPNADHQSINAALSGKAKFLGRGNDGLAFDAGDGNVVKAASDVPFHWNNGVRRQGEGNENLEKQVKTNEALRAAGVPGLLPQELHNHEGRNYAVMPKLDTDAPLSKEHIGQLADSINAMHAAGHTIGDDVQAGIGKDGKAYIYDTGAARKLNEHPRERDYDIEDDHNRLSRLAEKHGQKHKVERPSSDYDDALEAAWKDFNQMKEGDGLPPPTAKFHADKLKALHAKLDPDSQDFWADAHADAMKKLEPKESADDAAYNRHAAEMKAAGIATLPKAEWIKRRDEILAKRKENLGKAAGVPEADSGNLGDGFTPYQHPQHPGKWAAPVNKGKRGLGDTLHPTQEEASKEAIRHKNRFEQGEASKTEAANNAASAKQKKDEFKASGKTPVEAARQARAEAALGANVMSRGEVITRRKLLERDLDEGGNPELATIGGKEQLVMRKSDGVYRPLSKAEYDHAKSLLAKASHENTPKLVTESQSKKAEAAGGKGADLHPLAKAAGVKSIKDAHKKGLDTIVQNVEPAKSAALEALKSIATRLYSPQQANHIAEKFVTRAIEGTGMMGNADSGFKRAIDLVGNTSQTPDGDPLDLNVRDQFKLAAETLAKHKDAILGAFRGNAAKSERLEAEADGKSESKDMSGSKMAKWTDHARAMIDEYHPSQIELGDSLDKFRKDFSDLGPDERKPVAKHLKKIGAIDYIPKDLTATEIGNLIKRQVDAKKEAHEYPSRGMGKNREDFTKSEWYKSIQGDSPLLD